MPKTLSTSEAKNTLSAVINWVIEQRDEAIVEYHGAPRAVIISFAEYEELRHLKEEARRREALDRLRQARDQAIARNLDLSEKEIETSSDRFAHELIDDLASEGTLSFDRDAPSR